MRSAGVLVITILVCAAGCPGAEQSRIGKISDSMCGARHNAAAEHSTPKLSDADCTAACVKNGAKYIFVSKGKVYQVENQDFAGLQDHAGQTVRVTGEIAGDKIRLSQISPHIKPHYGEKSSL